MLTIHCPECGKCSRVPEDAPDDDGTVCCPRCAADFPVYIPRSYRRRKAASRPQPLSPEWVLYFGLMFAGLGLILSLCCGLWSSQYWPVFGGLIELNLAEPWSPARMNQIPAHLLAFGLIGLILGGIFGAVAGMAILNDTRK